jgi:Flp pilus assembly protein TadB
LELTEPATASTKAQATSKEGTSEMPAPTSSPWSTGPGGTGYRRHFRYGSGDLRASDAERTEVADRLSRHYQDGRLDQAEFNERLDRAMNAKTRADFNGLFADLPELPDQHDQHDQSGPARQSGNPPPFNPGRVPQRRGQRNSLSYFLFIGAVVVVAIVVAHSLVHSVFPWLLIAILAVLWLREEQHRQHRRR